MAAPSELLKKSLTLASRPGITLICRVSMARLMRALIAKTRVVGSPSRTSPAANGAKSRRF